MSKNKLNLIQKVVTDHFNKSKHDHGKIQSRYEGYAHLQKTMDDLWEATKHKQPYQSTHAVVTIAAIAIHYLSDLSSDEGLDRLGFVADLNNNVEH